MGQITLVKRNPAVIPEADKDTVRRVMFEIIDGLNKDEAKKWRRFWNMLFGLEPGECVDIITHKERLSWYHRKHMALEAAYFKQQETFTDFKHFRTWAKVGAGFCDWYAGPKGGVIPVPKSISYQQLDQTGMEAFHEDFKAFMSTPHAQKTMWPHLRPQQREEYNTFILASFNELQDHWQ